jgi:hypothetical protein
MQWRYHFVVVELGRVSPNCVACRDEMLAFSDPEESSNFTMLSPLGFELMERRLKDKSILKKNRLNKGSLHLSNLIFDDYLALD